jgi:acid phosphatase type 7
VTTDLRRQIALTVVAFAATLLLLIGLMSVLGRADGPTGAASPSPTPVRVTPTPSAPTPPPASPSASGSVEPSPSPSPGPLADAVLVGAGDIADCDGPGDEATAKLLDGIEGTIFTAGDNAYESGTAEEFRDCYGPTWGRFLDRTRPAAGNHDWVTEDAAGYLEYFGARAAPDGVTWYSYDAGTWHVIVLDSDCDLVGGCGPGSPQGQWLAADLASSPATCTLAIWHHPRFSSGQHGSDATVAPLWDALYAAGADLVVNGHDHDYERFAPQDPGGREDRRRGIREFVVGTGGRALRVFKDPVANSELRAAVTHGVLRLTLKSGSYAWSFLATSTDFKDAGSGPCH